MNSNKDVEYRLNLAKGFLKEAEEDFHLQRWRSCVDNSQLSIENAGKAILMLYAVTSKMHDCSKPLSQLVLNEDIPEAIRNQIKEILPEFLSLGAEEHFMTDYGDESSYILPWDIFNEESANDALKAAQHCTTAAEKIVLQVHHLRL